MKRDWGPAWQKVHDEAACRYCGAPGPLDPAHIVPRSRGGDMHPLNVVPLCRVHHIEYDGSRLELLPVLTLTEQSHVVRLVGIAEAFKRTTRQEVTV